MKCWHWGTKSSVRSLSLGVSIILGGRGEVLALGDKVFCKVISLGVSRILGGCGEVLALGDKVFC